MVVIAAIVEIEAEQHVERLDFQWADRQCVRNRSQHEAMLIGRGFKIRRIHVTRANPTRLDGTPAVMPLLFVFFQHVVATIAVIEFPHRRILLLHLLEVMQQRFATARKIHFRREIHIEIVIVAARSQVDHGRRSIPAKRSVELRALIASRGYRV
ncbi:MAG: hypothetical protein QM811_10035 [Pirellulales bacterium]